MNYYGNCFSNSSGIIVWERLLQFLGIPWRFLQRYSFNIFKDATISLGVLFVLCFDNRSGKAFKIASVDSSRKLFWQFLQESIWEYLQGISFGILRELFEAKKHAHFFRLHKCFKTYSFLEILTISFKIPPPFLQGISSKIFFREHFPKLHPTFGWRTREVFIRSVTARTWDMYLKKVCEMEGCWFSYLNLSQKTWSFYRNASNNIFRNLF